MGAGVYAVQPMQSAAVATGAGTAMDVLTSGDGSMSTWAAQVKGITTATITWQCTIDGTNWVNMQMTNVTSGTAAATATADGIFRGTVIGVKQVRANITAYTSGTINITGVVTAY